MIAATGTRNSVDFWVLSQDAGAGQPRKKPRQRSERCGDEDPVAHLRASTSLLGHTRKSLTTQTWSAFHPSADVSSAAPGHEGTCTAQLFREEKQQPHPWHSVAVEEPSTESTTEVGSTNANGGGQPLYRNKPYRADVRDSLEGTDSPGRLSICGIAGSANHGKIASMSCETGSFVTAICAPRKRAPDPRDRSGSSGSKR